MSSTTGDPSNERNRSACPYCKGTNLTGKEYCEHCGVYLRSRWRTGAWIEALPFASILRLIVTGLAGFAVAILLLKTPQQQSRHRVGPHCKNNLKQIALALHTYHDAFGTFPPAYIADENGRPMHSWRVLILPYLDETPLYKSYDFTKPWDAPENARVLNQMPEVFRCPSDEDAPANATSYAGVFGPGCVFNPVGPVRIRDIKNGTTNTLFVGEVFDAQIPWTKPQDIDVNRHPDVNRPGGFGSHHEGGCQFATCDGAVRFLPQTTGVDDLRTMFRIHDKRRGTPEQDSKD